MELDNSPRAAIRGGVRLIPTGADVAVQAGFAVAEDGGRSVAGGGPDGLVQPAPIPRRDKDFGVETPEGLGIRVVDLGAGHRAASGIGRVMVAGPPETRAR